MGQIFYADESGDLGWSFQQPYGKGGSSRFLVVASVSLPDADDHRPERVMKNLFTASKWNHEKEKKWVDASLKSRMHFSNMAVALVKSRPQIAFHAIVVKKMNVMPHLRDDGNKLYNYMVRLLLAEEMAKHNHVDFIPDPRSIKVESGNSMHDYLSIYLGCELNAPTALRTQKVESKFSKNLQFTDMISGIVHSHFEFGKSNCYNILSPYIKIKTLYF